MKAIAALAIELSSLLECLASGRQGTDEDHKEEEEKLA